MKLTFSLTITTFLLQFKSKDIKSVFNYNYNVDDALNPENGRVPFTTLN